MYLSSTWLIERCAVICKVYLHACRNLQNQIMTDHKITVPGKCRTWKMTDQIPTVWFSPSFSRSYIFICPITNMVLFWWTYYYQSSSVQFRPVITPSGLRAFAECFWYWCNVSAALWYSWDTCWASNSEEFNHACSLFVRWAGDRGCFKCLSCAKPYISVTWYQKHLSKCPQPTGVVLLCCIMEAWVIIIIIIIRNNL